MTNALTAKVFGDGYTRMAKPGWKNEGWLGYIPSATPEQNNIYLSSLMSEINNNSIIEIPSGIYLMKGVWNIIKPCKIISKKAIFDWTGDTSPECGISIQSSNVEINNISLIGPGISPLNYNCNAIKTSESGISSITLKNLTISQWAGMGILLRHTDKFNISSCEISSVMYSGIGVESSTNGIITFNKIDDVRNTPNSYGIYLSRQNSDSLISSPRTKNVTVSHNIISNIPNWEALDTHGGENIIFSENIINNCFHGIVVGSSDDSSHNPKFASLNCLVLNNIMDSQNSSGLYGYGIAFVGAFHGGIQELSTGIISNNQISNYGSQINPIHGSIYIHTTESLHVIGNSILNPSPTGIHIYHGNHGVLISSNSITDAWSNDNISRCIYVNSSGNTGVISDNAFLRSTKSANSVMENGIRFDNEPTNMFILNPNYFECTSDIIGTPEP